MSSGRESPSYRTAGAMIAPSTNQAPWSSSPTHQFGSDEYGSAGRYNLDSSSYNGNSGLDRKFGPAQTSDSDTIRNAIRVSGFRADSPRNGMEDHRGLDHQDSSSMYGPKLPGSVDRSGSYSRMGSAERPR